MLEDEFGTSRDDDVMQKIMEKGTIIESEVTQPANDSSWFTIDNTFRQRVAMEARMSRKDPWSLTRNEERSHEDDSMDMVL